MKFVIKSLLFLNLFIQLTSSLRKCFNQEPNLMLTIILLAFSIIGLIGLIIGNRFILIIFAASSTLILIASITIYEIGKTQTDLPQPKVPYYQAGPPTEPPTTRGPSRKWTESGSRRSVSRNRSRSARPTPSEAAPTPPAAPADEPEEPSRVPNEQWVAYERRLYERYLDMVSQSIDLLLHAILASWMASLLDEEADQCFGSPAGARPPKEVLYNYNGVRYSIRPDSALGQGQGHGQQARS